MSRLAVYVGIPKAGGELAEEAAHVATHRMVSAGAFYDPRYGVLRAPGLHAWRGAVALDSGGYVAMLQGGYRWSVADYVEWVALTRCNDDDFGGSLPFPWVFWSQMDFCCEPKIAPDRAEVDRRIELTAATLGECLDNADYWRDEEGVPWFPDPLPVLQGRRPEDYLRSAELAVEQLRARGRELPELIGVGSVCRRPVDGPEGLVHVVRALDEALPAGVRLHLFGVKGSIIGKLGPALDRVASLDSQAWDLASREDCKRRRRAGEVGVKNTNATRLDSMRRWYARPRGGRVPGLTKTVAILDWINRDLGRPVRLVELLRRYGIDGRTWRRWTADLEAAGFEWMSRGSGEDTTITVYRARPRRRPHRSPRGLITLNEADGERS